MANVQKDAPEFGHGYLGPLKHVLDRVEAAESEDLCARDQRVIAPFEIADRRVVSLSADHSDVCDLIEQVEGARWLKDSVPCDWHSGLDWPEHLAAAIMETFEALKARQTSILGELR